MSKTGTENRWLCPLASLGLVLSLAACSYLPDLPDFGDSSSSAPLGTTVTSVSTGYEQREVPKNNQLDTENSSFAGAVVADEPNAALIGRGVLEEGGNAADAATAIYFALSVTYPAAAGLGGGGVCLVHQADRPTIESVSFFTRRPLNGTAAAVPGNVRGFAALQAKYGSQEWSAVVAPAERLAATGFPASRALVHQLDAVAPIIAANAGLSEQFTKEGRPLRELDVFTQPNLAATLALVRSQGLNGFYSGAIADRLVSQSNDGLSNEDLRNYRAEISPAQITASDNMSVALPAQNLGAGAFSGALWRAVDGVSGADALAAAANRVAETLGASGPLSDDFGSTSFTAVDSSGGAVACAVTMNGAFGSGQVVKGTGVVLASSPLAAVKGLASAFLAPVIILNSHTHSIFFVGAGAGAPKGAAAIEGAAHAALAQGQSVDATLAASPADVHSPASAISCPTGLPGQGSCTISVSPGGNGVGFSAISPNS